MNALLRPLRQFRQLFKPTKPASRFLREARGVIHVGANSGQERDLYWRHGLEVLWVEPIPEVFAVLEKNIAGYRRQRALSALVTNEDGRDYPFNVSSNRGQSSSILPLHLHKTLWPGVDYERTITLRGRTLPALLKEHAIDTTRFDTLVMDTQGSELLVLQGAEAMLPQFKFIKTEAPDFEAYKGCCLVNDLAAWLGARGYTELSRHAFAGSPESGHYYDVVYGREGGGGAAPAA